MAAYLVRFVAVETTVVVVDVATGTSTAVETGIRFSSEGCLVGGRLFSWSVICFFFPNSAACSNQSKGALSSQIKQNKYFLV